MIIRQATAESDFDSIIKMAGDNLLLHYDCSYDEYLKITKKLFKQSNFRAWIAEDNGIDAGYITAAKDIGGYFNQVNILEIFVCEEFRMSEAAWQLIFKAMKWSIDIGVKRVAWMSQEIPGPVWSKLIGLPVNHIQMYSCEVG